MPLVSSLQDGNDRLMMRIALEIMRELEADLLKLVSGLSTSLDPNHTS